MSKLKFISCCIALNLICLFQFTSEFVPRFFTDGLLFFFGGIILLRYNPFKTFKGASLIFAPFIIIYTIVVIDGFFESSYAVVPHLLITILSALICIFFYKLDRLQIIKLAIAYLILLSFLSYILPNYYNYIRFEGNQKTYDKIQVKDIDLYDSEGNKIDLINLHGKVIILDIWNSSCAVCIEEFPQFEKLNNEFGNDDSIVFYNVNLSMKSDTRERVSKFTSNYGFKKLYGDSTVIKVLDVKLFPQYLVIDKNSKIIYSGSLNIGKNLFYNNFYKIINKAKHEN